MIAQAKAQAKTFSIFNDALGHHSVFLDKSREPNRAEKHNERKQKNDKKQKKRWKCHQIIERQNMPKLLSVGEVANQLSVSRSTVYRLVDSGKLKRLYVLSSPRISESEVERLVGCGK